MIPRTWGIAEWGRFLAETTEKIHANRLAYPIERIGLRLTVNMIEARKAVKNNSFGEVTVAFKA
jgi:hypothetical protein